MYTEHKSAWQEAEEGAQGEWEREGQLRKRGKPTAAKPVSPLV